MITEWNDTKLLNKVDDLIEESARSGAVKVAQAARSLAPWDSGVLATSIKIEKSKFKDGGYMVVAQGPNNYDRFYATFVELGTYKTRPQPFLRPALHQNKESIRREFENKL